MLGLADLSGRNSRRFWLHVGSGSVVQTEGSYVLTAWLGVGLISLEERFKGLDCILGRSDESRRMSHRL